MITFVTKNFTVLIILVMGILLASRKGVSSFFDTRGEADQKDTGGSTISENSAEAIAENLYNAMASMGTDENLIFSEFAKIQTEANYNKVFEAFGKRVYSETWGNGGSIPGLSDLYDLTEWLTKELTPDEQEELGAKYPELNLF